MSDERDQPQARTGARRTIPPRAPTIHDVAAAAGVSPRTVSRVLNKSPKVKENTRQTIEALFDQLGFSPNSRARGLPSGKSYLIGLIQNEPNAHVIGLVQEGIVDVAQKAGYELVVHPVTLRGSELLADIKNFVQRSRVDGVIVLPPVSESSDIPLSLDSLGIPAVALAARPIDGYPFTVASNERQVCSDMADHLIELGHRNIALITGPSDFLSSQERSAGFREGLAARNVVLPDDYVIASDYSFEGGQRAAQRLLTLPTPPTAIFAGNDRMAAGVIKIAQAMNLQVPKDLSVAGFDDSEMAAMLSPGLTTIRRPVRMNAVRATETLMRLIDAKDEIDPCVHVELSLVIRQSTQPPSA